ncbi:MAG TPA: tRNA epoxyqueuosine(34) reductase QueG [Luteibaculaceae bacterium]|nr:tRNA epoxyqueuosine(34) reductase QueG [Luteibaculaceae bacterium]
MTPRDRSLVIKAEAQRLGFDFCGISTAGFLEEEAPRLEKWLKEGRHGAMGYMENHFDKRLDPRLLVPGAKSVVSLMFNYYTPAAQADAEAPKISKYAYGDDYHHVVKDKLKALMEVLRSAWGEIDGRVFVDSAPVLERAWAQKSGLGWMGKNTNLINRKAGSFYFLAEMIIDVELDPDGPIKDYCGTCTRCIDACPTEAIVAPYVVDGSKCISYFTIELRDQIPSDYAAKLDNWMFGCDVCQDVCPWNRFSTPHREPLFQPQEELLRMSKTEWQELTEEVFGSLFRKSAVKRTKFAGLKRNIEAVTINKG